MAVVSAVDVEALLAVEITSKAEERLHDANHLTQTHYAASKQVIFAVVATPAPFCVCYHMYIAIQCVQSCPVAPHIFLYRKIGCKKKKNKCLQEPLLIQRHPRFLKPIKKQQTSIRCEVLFFTTQQEPRISKCRVRSDLD